MVVWPAETAFTRPLLESTEAIFGFFEVHFTVLSEALDGEGTAFNVLDPFTVRLKARGETETEVTLIILAEGFSVTVIVHLSKISSSSFEVAVIVAVPFA